MASTGRIYTRKSRHLGDPDDPSLMAHHLALLQRLAAERGIEIVQVIEEIGGGETIVQRPHFQSLILAYEQGRFRDEALLVVEFSRLTRGDQAEVGRVMRALTRANIRLITPAGDYDLKEADHEFLLGLLSLVSRNELQRYRQRVKVKLDEMTREGKLVGGMVPYGYRWDFQTKKPVPDPERFPVLQAWCKEILTDSSATLAARYGVPFDLICRTLRNPTICGYPARRWEPHQGRKAWRSRTMRLPRSEWTWPETIGDYEAACSRAEWDAIQAALDARLISRSATWTTDGWCRRVLQFHSSPEVGDPLPGAVGLSWRSRPARYSTYLLRQRGADGEYRSGPFIPRATVHAAATEALRQLFREPAPLIVRARAFEAQQAAEKARGQSDHEAAILKLAEKRRLLDTVSLAELTATDPEHQDSLRRHRESLTTEIRALSRRAPARPQEPVPLSAAVLQSLAPAFEEQWAATSDAEKALLVGAFLESIHVYVDSYRGRRKSVRVVIGWDYQPWTGKEPVRIEMR